MKLIKRIFSVVTVIACVAGMCRIDEYIIQAQAASNLVFDYSNIEKMPQNQFYFSDEDEFFIDGVKVLYNNQDVTKDVTFTFYTTPESTYDGKNIDYTVPFIAEYDGKAAEGRLDVKIGMRGDANCDHKISLGDLVLIQNDLFQTYTAGKSALTTNERFGIFLANADGRQTDNKSKYYGTNLLNIGDAFFLSSYLNGKGNSVYQNILLNNAIKNNTGEIHISDCNAKAGQKVNVPVFFNTNSAIGAFDITCKWSGSDLIPLGAFAKNKNTTVFSVVKADSMKIMGFASKDAVKSGELIYLQFAVPDYVSKNTKYDITVSSIDYFGSAVNISELVYTYDGVVTVNASATVSGQQPESALTEIKPYDFGVKVWDAVLEYGETKAQLPVMLLGGLETSGLKMTVKCDEKLTVNGLPNADLISGNSADGFVGIYSSDTILKTDFEMLDITVDKNAKPGKYPVSIVIENVAGLSENSKFEVFDGSVTVKDKPSVNGDANMDNVLNVRDCAHIASMLSKGKVSELPDTADFNSDGEINVRDAAAIAKKLAAD